ncbi:hypothetical protein AAZV13_04G098800 [Glycine max]
MLKHENLGCFNLDFCEALKAIILSSSPILYSIHLLLCYVFLYKYGSKARPKRCVRFFNNCYCYGGVSLRASSPSELHFSFLLTYLTFPRAKIVSTFCITNTYLCQCISQAMEQIKCFLISEDGF